MRTKPPTRDRETQRGNYRTWYGNHVEEFNARRREKYRNDAEVRNKAIEQAATYRRTMRETGGIPNKRGNYNTSTRVAAIFGMHRQTLLNWEAKNFIPKPTVSGKHRLYSDAQVELLLAVVESSGDREQFEKARTNMFVRWHDASSE